MTPAELRKLAADWALDSGVLRNSMEDAADEIERLLKIVDAADRLAFRVEEVEAYRDEAFALQDMVSRLKD